MMMKKPVALVAFLLFICIVAVGCGSITGAVGVAGDTGAANAGVAGDIGTLGETDPDGKRLATPSDTDHFPLYAMIREEDIYLYGMQGYGMILHYKGTDRYLDWPGLTPRFILPQMLYHDFDGDGIKDLAVMLYRGSGTGVSMMDLHILKISDERDPADGSPIYTDYALSGSDVADWVTEPISAAPAEDGATLVVNVCGDSYEVEALSEYAFADVIYGGGVVCFEFDNTRIRADIGVAALYKEIAMPQFIGQMEANVIFDGAHFFLEDYTFSPY